MKSNPYVYPFIPFEDLSNKSFKDHFLASQTITVDQLRDMVLALPYPQPTITHTTPAEQVLDLFADENYRYGPKEFMEEERALWLERLNGFIAKNQPIQAIILGFPFKIPVPLKSSRVLPDMGEVLSLRRLWVITELVRQFYAPGMIITVYTEGVFGAFTGVSKQESDAYRDRLAELATLLGFNDRLHIVDLEDLEALAPNFRERFKELERACAGRYDAGDPKERERYTATYPSVYRITATRNYPLELLMDVYNDQLTNDATSDDVRRIRADIHDRTHKAIFAYHAYHQARYDTGVMDKAMPGAIYLTVSPKKGRLGIYPIDRDVVRLPYHGVPVLNDATHTWSIDYLVDLRRRPGPYLPVHLEDDKDQAPFYYRIGV